MNTMVGHHGGSQLLQAFAVTVAALTVASLGQRPLVDAVVVFGLGVIAPLALGRSMRWTAAAVSSAAALVSGPGPVATVLAMPALVAAVGSFLSAVASLDVRGIASALARMRSLDALAVLLGPVWAVAAVGALLASTARVDLFGIGEPIVRLTAVHYLYAGVGALAVARRLRDERGSTRTTTLALVATALAPPIVAVGFVLGGPVPQIGGAILMTIGVWASATVLVARAFDGKRAGTSALRLAAGLAPWIPMVFAVAWASAQHVADVPALSIPDMARFHGLANGIGFVLLGLLATRPSARTATEEQMLLEVRV